tara:strand:+ start:55 stop:648 length:594 start_codon:yes stop_codon:yes gene_type:complete
MALPKQILYIDANYIKAYSHITGNVDENDLLPSIIQAQDSQIQPILGTNLYNKLKTLIKDGSISDVGNAAYETLLQDYVQMCTMKWTLVYFYPYLHGNIGNGIIGTRNIDNMTSLSQDEVNSLIDTERSNAQFYTERLINYLLLGGQQTALPEYNQDTLNQMTPETQAYSEGGLTISGQNYGTNRLAKWNCCGGFNS